MTGDGLSKAIEILKDGDKAVPNFPVIDTVTFRNGRPSALMYFD